MKKIDFHIHTIASPRDSFFEFSIETLKEYINTSKLDAIAVTNHNLFDKQQFEIIVEELPNIFILPGIEINLQDSHVIIITNNVEVDDFHAKCLKVSHIIEYENRTLNVEDLIDIYGDLSKYLIIPHYEKDPKISSENLEKLRKYITCGEVNSPKKFIHLLKRENDLVPCYFSDFRVKCDVDNYPIRQMYIDANELSFSAVRHALADKSKVALSSKDGVEMITAFPGLEISSKLNVIIGGRSSGKSYSLNKIFENYDNVKYIKQFELLEIDQNKEEKSFEESIAAERSIEADEYLRPFKKVVDSVIDISVEKDEKKISEYIKSLLKSAQEIERKDNYAKCKLFNESTFSIDNLENLRNLISATETLLDSTQYAELIEKSVERDKLINLLNSLIEKYRSEFCIYKKKEYANACILSIKDSLQSKTSATKVKDANFYTIALNRKKVSEFNHTAKFVKQACVIRTEELGRFKIEIAANKFESAGELKKYSKSNKAFSGAFEKYDSPYEYLLQLKEIDSLQHSELYKYFVNIKYRILNEYGFEVSGGERAEFKLLQAINDAYHYDMLLIDEPESSFDNLFLKNSVNKIIKEIAENMPVVIVTHNSTVGASIKPNYLIHTQRVVENGQVKFLIFYGGPGDKYLYDSFGNKIENLGITLDCLEAGESAYMERRHDYEILGDI